MAGKAWCWILTGVVLLLLAGALAAYLYYDDLARTPLESEETVTIEVPSGADAAAISELLTAEGVTRHPRLFRLYLRLEDLDTELHAGTFELPRPACFADIAAVLTSDEVVTRRLTIPEGLTVERIADMLEADGFCTVEEFFEAAEELAGERLGGESVEGRLFPDTYDVAVDADAAALVERLFERADAVWKAVVAEFGEPVEPTTDRKRVLTLASIVQAEGATESEFPIIAGVFVNRLERGMVLESCATVLYALGEHKQVLEYRDLEIDSPYNTYKHPGLPPGPINCPGRAALEAVLSPVEHDYLFFVSNGDGTHTFSRTLAEHNAARAATREARAAAVAPEGP